MNNNHSATTNQKPIDSPSYLNQFGWERIAEDFAIPVIVRSNGERYSPVRIVEQEIIKKYDALPQGVFNCITLKSFYLTAMEAKLLNNINFNHCNSYYGESFFSTRDVIINATDVKELSRFLEVSRKVFTENHTQLSNHFGILTITIDPQNPSLKLNVPYICKYFTTQNKLCRFIPAQLVEPFVINIMSKSVPTDWDIMYLKMFCIFSEHPNIANQLHLITRENLIIQLDGLLYKKTNTPIIYEDYLQANWQI